MQKQNKTKLNKIKKRTNELTKLVNINMILLEAKEYIKSCPGNYISEDDIFDVYHAREKDLYVNSSMERNISLAIALGSIAGINEKYNNEIKDIALDWLNELYFTASVEAALIEEVL